MDHVLLLFDIDGTLLHTHGVGVDVMKRVGTRMFGDHYSMDGVIFSGNLDPLIYAEAAHHNQVPDHHLHHDQFRDTYVAELATALEAEQKHGRGATLLPGVKPLIDLLDQRQREVGDVMLGLLTGNYTSAVPLKLRAAGLNPDVFHITAFGDEAPNRPGLTALAMNKYQSHTGKSAHGERVIIIGDTPRDVDCAKAHQCTAVAVATGKYTAEQLRQAGADLVLENLLDPAPLLKLIDGTPSLNPQSFRRINRKDAKIAKRQ